MNVFVRKKHSCGFIFKTCQYTYFHYIKSFYSSNIFFINVYLCEYTLHYFNCPD